MKLELRNDKSKDIRELGLVPGVMYAKGFETIHVQADLKELNKKFSQKGMTLSFEVDLENEKHIVLFKEIQRDVLLASKILHFDLIKVSAKDTITASIPIRLIGREIVEGHGHVVQLINDTIECEYPVTKGISFIEVDISHLVAGDTFTAGEISLPDDILLKAEESSAILSVTHPQIIEDDETDDSEEISSEDDASETVE